MAASPLPPPRPALFRFLTLNGWSHARVPGSVPVELVEPRPPVPSPTGGGEACNGCFYTSPSFGMVLWPLSVV